MRVKIKFNTVESEKIDELYHAYVIAKMKLTSALSAEEVTAETTEEDTASGN